MAIPFLLRRPLLLIQGTILDRRSPDLDRLGAIPDPDRFGWAILPHVARSFAASVVLLPTPQARAARVGYLYARMLDTYEDMVPDPAERVAGLEWFTTRFASNDLTAPAPPATLVATTPGEQVHRLLVERVDLIDRLYLDLPAADRSVVATMVGSMASSMRRWGDAFAAQGGALESSDQLDRYCDDVIGEPARFAVRLLVRDELTAEQQRLVSTVSEFIQLANVTRDIERDLAHGVTYHPDLRPWIGVLPTAPDAVEAVRVVRQDLLVRALGRSPAYVELLEDLPLPRLSQARASGLLMLLFTDRYYRSCAVRAGHEPWRGIDSSLLIGASCLLASVSRRWTLRVARRVERRFLEAADRITG